MHYEAFTASFTDEHFFLSIYLSYRMTKHRLSERNVIQMQHYLFTFQAALASPCGGGGKLLDKEL